MQKMASMFSMKRSFSAHNTRSSVAVAQSVKDSVKSWFSGPDKFECSGEAFAVFNNNFDANDVLETFHATPKTLKHASWPHAEVKVSPPPTQPPSVYWWHFGVTRQELKCKEHHARFKVVILIIAVQVCVFLPFNMIFVKPYAEAASLQAGPFTTVAGALLGNMNLLVCITMWFTFFGLGYRQKSKLDVNIFWTNLLLSLVNIGVCVALQLKAASVAGGFNTMFRKGIHSMSVIGDTAAMAQYLYNFLIPGFFFIGFLMGPIMANLVPYCWNTLLMKIIYVWRCFPRPILAIFKLFLPFAPDDDNCLPVRNAEMALQPIELGLAWDSDKLIIMPTLCFCMLLFQSPVVPVIFLRLMEFSIFFYMHQRYWHFFVAKTAYHNSWKINLQLSRAWFIPQGIVAIAAAHWGIHAFWQGPALNDLEHVSVCLLAFCLSTAMWLCCQSRVRYSQLKLQSEQLKDFHKHREECLFNWFNVNPMLALKTKYCCELLGEHRVVTHLWEIGRETFFYYVTKDGKKKRRKVGADTLHDFQRKATKKEYKDSTSTDVEPSNWELELWVDRLIALPWTYSAPLATFSQLLRGRWEADYYPLLHAVVSSDRQTELLPSLDEEMVGLTSVGVVTSDSMTSADSCRSPPLSAKGARELSAP